MASIIRNLRFSLRVLRKSPGLTATVALTLALGVGAVTAIYTAVYATLIAAMPYPNPDELVIVWSYTGGHQNGVAAGDFTDWRAQNHSFVDLKAFTGTSFNMASAGSPEMVRAQYTTPGMYSMMGNKFLMGRDFLPEEGVAGKEQVVILMNKFWKRLGADPNILGKTITLDQKPYTVVGVLAPGQADRLDQQLVAPLVFTPKQLNHDFHWLLVMGRLKHGVSIKQAQADMDSVTANVARAYPREDTGWGARVDPLQNDFLDSSVKTTLWLLLGAVGCVLLIACVNVANLLLARGISRQREIAIRTSVGATRGTIFAQFVTESLVLALMGGLLGVAVGFAMLRGLVAMMPDGTLPSEADLSLNLPVLLVCLGATTLAGLLFGCAPAWYASRLDPAETLKEGGRSGASKVRHRLRQALVVGEFTLALAVLAGAGLALHSFWNLAHVDVGVQTDHVLTFWLPENKGAHMDSDQLVAHYRQIVEKLESTVGVESASAAVGMPLEGAGFGMPFTLEGDPPISDPSKRHGAAFQMVTPDYTRTFGIRMVRGRTFTNADNTSSVKVAMVNEKFVKSYLKGRNPIGVHVNVEQLVPGVQQLGPYQSWEIVGVFHDVRGGSFERQREEIDIPFYQIPWVNAGFGVRTAVEPETMKNTIAAAVHTIDPNVALSDVKTLDQIRDEALSGDRFDLILYVGFALIALTLSGVGIYGVIAFSVGQREHEIGIRMALGASRGRVVRMILGEGAVLAGLGLVLGLIGAFFVGRAMQSTLYGIGKLDLPAFAAVGMMLVAAALLASYLPARRASRVEPIRALRTE